MNPISGTIFDRSLIPSGWRRIGGTTDIPYGHSTMYSPDANQRISWDNPGMQNIHGTNQNVPPGDPNRHFDPR